MRVAACATFRLGQRKAWQARLPSLFLSSYFSSHSIVREYFPFLKVCDVVLIEHKVTLQVLKRRKLLRAKSCQPVGHDEGKDVVIGEVGRAVGNPIILS